MGQSIEQLILIEIKRSSQLRTILKRVVENRRFEIYSLPSIFLELILITKLRAAFKPRLQSFIKKK